jgi:hypothetical protein
MDEFDQKTEKQIDGLNDTAAAYEGNVDSWKLLIKETLEPSSDSTKKKAIPSDPR